MPASNAVLGAAVVGAAGFAGYQMMQEKAIQREENEARKEFEKRAQDQKERAEQQRQKEGIEAEQRSNVGYTMARQKEDVLLFDLLHDVYDAVAQRRGTRPCVNLPLLRLPGSPDSPSEAVLGVGLLLGMEPSLLMNALEKLSERPDTPPLGLAAGSLTCESLLACAQALEAVANLGVPKHYLCALDKDGISCFLSLTFHATAATGPMLLSLKCRDASAVVGARDLANHLGMLALPWAWLEQARKLHPGDDFVVFRPNSSTHNQKGFMALDAASAFVSLGESKELTLFNFQVTRDGFCFRVARDADGAATYNRAHPLPPGLAAMHAVGPGVSAKKQRQRRHFEEPTPLALFPRDANTGSLLLAQLNVYHQAKVGASRLRALAKRASTSAPTPAGAAGPAGEPTRFLSARGVSLEHLMAASGELATVETMLLQGLRGGDQELIVQRQEEITKQLAAGLRRVLLAPSAASSGVDGQASSAGEQAEEPDEAVRAQIDAFVPSYVRLLRIRLSRVPCLADGSYPHEVVASQPLSAEAKRGYLNCPTVAQARRARDLLRADEHSRDVEMRSLGTLPRAYTVGVGVAYGLLLLFVCHGTLHACLTRLPGLRMLDPSLTSPAGQLCVALALGFALWIHSSLMHVACAHRLCDLAAADSSAEAASRLRSASYAALGRRLGWRTALERELLPLEAQCQATLHGWLGRLARRRYYEALRRRRIGAHEAAALLEDLFTASEQASKASKRGRPSRVFFWRRSSTRYVAKPRTSSKKRAHHQPKSQPQSQQQQRPTSEQRHDAREEQARRTQAERAAPAAAATRRRHVFKQHDTGHGGAEMQQQPEQEADDDDDDDDDDDAIAEEGARLPGTLQDAEAFLGLPVFEDDEGGVPSTPVRPHWI